MEQLPLFQPTLYTVGDLTRYLKALLEGDELLQDVWVQGEISNFSRPASGHLYFTLKDSSAALRCVMWRPTALRFGAGLRDGLAIEAHGGISVYEQGGQYQLYIDLLRPAGKGALWAEFLRLKAQLEAEGLFDPSRKRPLPEWPHRIGIITSPTGAALQDMLNVLRRRYALAEVLLAPTPVQGVEAPAGILKALALLNSLPEPPDVILLAGGGGSIEDLWAFNDERVARAVAASPIPVVTGVGHETDFTIADFASDPRAPTPTAAAELITPNRDDLLLDLQQLTGRMGLAMQNLAAGFRWQLTDLQNRLKRTTPLARVQQERQRVDDLAERAARAAGQTLSLRRARLEGLSLRLGALGPQGVLARGYAIVTQAQTGRVVRSIYQVNPADPLSIRLADGKLNADVTDVPPNPTGAAHE